MRRARSAPFRGGGRPPGDASPFATWTNRAASHETMSAGAPMVAGTERVTAAAVHAAARLIAPHVVRTPILTSDWVDAAVGARAYFKVRRP